MLDNLPLLAKNKLVKKTKHFRLRLGTRLSQMLGLSINTIESDSFLDESSYNCELVNNYKNSNLIGQMMFIQLLIQV